MNKLTNWFKDNRNSVIRNSFLLPILLVVIMSISHVVSWYDLGNPFSWAIYLSVAIEVFALASVSAATIKINRASIWFLFGLVTFIQIIGNIFFEYRDINISDPAFLAWVEMIQPLFEDWTPVDHRRLLAAVQGGTLPLMSLTALHYYIKFTDLIKGNEEPENEVINKVDAKLTHEPAEDLSSQPIDAVDFIAKTLKEELEKAIKNEPIDEEAILNEKIEEPLNIAELETTPEGSIQENLDALDKIEEQNNTSRVLGKGPGVYKPVNQNFGPPVINNGSIS
jgi:hypothetical protein